MLFIFTGGKDLFLFIVNTETADELVIQGATTASIIMVWT